MYFFCVYECGGYSCPYVCLFVNVCVGSVHANVCICVCSLWGYTCSCMCIPVYAHMGGAYACVCMLVMCVRECTPLCVYMLLYVHGGEVAQRMTLCSWFSPSFTLVLGSELRSPDLYQKCLFLIGHFAIPSWMLLCSKWLFKNIDSFILLFFVLLRWDLTFLEGKVYRIRRVNTVLLGLDGLFCNYLTTWLLESKQIWTN